MRDFYSELNARENEALRRASRLGEQERIAAERFHNRHTPPEQQAVSPPPPAHGGSPLSSLFGGSILNSELLSSPDLSLIGLLFLILHREQNDPLLMLALVYILM